MEKKVETVNKGRIKWDIGDGENGDLKDQHSVQLQKVAAEFVANIIAQSISKLALEMEQNKQKSERVDSESSALRMKHGKLLEKKIYGDNISKQPFSLRSKSPVKSKTCVLL
ncbi:uncharacterized protein LOC117100712 [Anneissia japonica]|uniref:uncharacterized protein LOC117100712 n=1 Tax=Anneissia japonica TaxID=1529436 RepID=UPI001425BA8A|nr:uncharacterized protein LOC117100712 [Anneissia japonica]